MKEINKIYERRRISDTLFEFPRDFFEELNEENLEIFFDIWWKSNQKIYRKSIKP